MVYGGHLLGGWPATGNEGEGGSLLAGIAGVAGRGPRTTACGAGRRLSISQTRPRRTASSMRVATSATRTSAPWLATPSESMVVQKGQAVAMTRAPVPMTSRERYIGAELKAVLP